MPDGVLATPSARWAVEVELSPKSNGDYARIVRWYAAQPGYRRVAWYAAEESVRRRLERAIAAERLGDYVSALPLLPEVVVRRWE